MRKQRIKLPDGKEIEITVSEVDISLDAEMTVEDYRRKKADESRFDAELDQLADEIISKAPKTEMDTRTIIYWEIGDLVSRFIRRVSDGGSAGKEPYRVHERAFARLIDKMNERVKGDPQFSEKGFSVPSVPYLKKWERFARRFTRSQAERPIPYSLAHELIDDKLRPEDIDLFLDKCETNELKTNIEVRDAVNKFLTEKGLKAARLRSSEEDL